MPDYDYDLIVIGGGSGGVRGSRFAAKYGARVLVIESGRLGGTCVNVGCVPKKLLSYGAHYSDHLSDMAGYGWTVEGASHDWSVLKRHKDAEIDRLNGIYEQVLDNAGVELLRGRATVAGPHAVRVGDREIRARYMLVAVGGHPWRPTEAELPGVQHTWTSDDIFALEALPDRILVVGGGYIACEMASILNGLGVEAHLAYRGDQLLRGFDHDVRREVSNELRRHGVRLHFGCAPVRVEKTEKGCLRVDLDDGDTVEIDALLMATGRVPNTAGLGLEAAGVQLDARGAIQVDDRFQSTCPSIFAVGDVIDRVQLTPVALSEAMVVARNLFHGADDNQDYDFIPTAVFTHPNVGTVGLTEEQARKRFARVRVYRSLFRPMLHTLTKSSEKMLMKLLVDDATDRVVGLHVVGDEAGEIVQGFAVAMKCGATKAQFDSTIGIHPTAAEELVTMRTPVPEE